jgi:hypothetical protein
MAGLPSLKPLAVGLGEEEGERDQIYRREDSSDGLLQITRVSYSFIVKKTYIEEKNLKTTDEILASNRVAFVIYMPLQQ